MNFTFNVDDLTKAMEGKADEIAVAAQQTMQRVTAGLKDDLRADIAAAGLGPRMANTWRGNTYPQNRNSMNAASYVFSKAPKIVDAFSKTTTYTARYGKFLAIPTENAGTGTGGAHISPTAWQAKMGVRLQFVKAKDGRCYLTALLRKKKGEGGGYAKATPKTPGKNIFSVIIYYLVPKVTQKQRLDLDGIAQRWAAKVPAILEANLRA